MNLGLIPLSYWHLLAAIPPVILWKLSLPKAKSRHVVGWHNASLAVSFWEEILFRGLVLGLVLDFSHSAILAIVISSILFGAFHLRNLWLADKKQVLLSCLYAGLFIGPVLAVVRIWSGDIYIGVLLHYLNNFVSMSMSNSVPTDEFLVTKRHRQNWFERFFSGYWVHRL